MKRLGRSLLAFSSLSLLAVAGGQEPPHRRLMENLGRAVVAVPESDDAVLVSWRLLGTDPADVAFNVYRICGDGSPILVNEEPLTKATNVIDSQVDFAIANVWYVRPIVDGREQAASRRFEVPASDSPPPYLSVPLKTPDGYRPNDASVGDLDGDGEYEIVLHQVGRGRDNSQRGMTTEPILEAYRLDGTMLWRINLGRNIREGAHYTQFMVYDLDSDGRAEVACKTADGTVDGIGTVIGDADADYRNDNGYILDGPEYLTIFDGQTGAALATTDYVPPRGNVSAWGDSTGNRVDRFLACVAYLDGRRPSLVMCRGYYTRCVLAAWNWRDGELQHIWTFDSDDGSPGNDAYRGQGNHGIAVGDVDADGRDEIIYGSCVIDDDGSGLYSTGYGHGDAMHFTDVDPLRPGLEVLKANGDGPSPSGLQLRDAATGEQIYGVESVQRGGVGRAASFDIDPRFTGLESWGIDTPGRSRRFGRRFRRERSDSRDANRDRERSTNNGRERERSANRPADGEADRSSRRQQDAGRGNSAMGIYDVHGQKISDKMPRTCNMGIWWDGDELRELLDGIRVSKWDYEGQQEAEIFNGRDFDCVSNNGSKSNPSLCADILGDWREEIIAATRDGRELRIFVTNIPTERRIYTLMHDPIYRLAVAWQNVSYNQPAHPGFYLGAGMTEPPRPQIELVRPERDGDSSL